MSSLEEYQLQAIRKECYDEQNLISFRMTWTLMIEAFLFTTFAITLGNGAYKTFWWFTFVVIPFIGIFVALNAKKPINAAIETINFWHKKESEFFEKNPEFKLLDRRGRGDHIHWLSMQYPKQITTSLVLIWLTLGVFGLLQAFGKIPNLLP